MDAPTQMGQRADLRDFLAAERTFLAWIRTGLALMGFGFVVARFGLFLQQLQVAPAHLHQRRLTACRCGSARPLSQPEWSCICCPPGIIFDWSGSWNGEDPYLLVHRLRPW